MAIAIRQGATADNFGTGTSRTINAPSNVNGDLLVFFEGAYTGSGVTLSGPGAGWTLIAQVSASNYTLAAYWHRASSEPTTYTYTNSSSGFNCAAFVMAFYDTGGGTVAVGASTNAIQNSNASFTTPALTPNDATADKYELVVNLFGAQGINTLTLTTAGYYPDQAGNGAAFAQLVPCLKGSAAQSITVTDTAARNWALISLALYNSGAATTQLLGLRCANFYDNNGSSVNPIVVPMPVNTVAGDFMLAIMCVTGTTSATFTAPTGWVKGFGEHGNSLFSIAAYYRTASASEPSSYSWTSSTSSPSWGTALLVFYQDSGGTITLDQIASTDPGSSPYTSPTLTTSGANELVLSLWRTYFNAQAVTYSVVTDASAFRNNSNIYPARQDNWSGFPGAVYSVQAAAGASTARTVTISGSAGACTSFQVALKPALSAGPKQPTIVVASA